MFPQSPAIIAAAGFPDVLTGAPPEGLAVRELARRLGVTPRALRFYEEKKLMPPPRFGAHRQHYRSDDALRMAFIVACRRIGLALADIAALLKALDRNPDQIDVLALRLDEHVGAIEEQRALLSEQRRFALDWLERIGHQPLITVKP
jgi:DNA-binding transcriptional MerR regulator